MAARTKKTSVAEAPEDASSAIPPEYNARLRKLVIRNFGCIGTTPVEIDLDDIVVLVGPNNAGKSTILRAYHVLFTSQDPTITIDDVPNHVLDPDNPPCIELYTAVNANPPGHRWIFSQNGENVIRERWTWSATGEKAKRQGFDAIANDWAQEVPYGAANVANSRRPKPHRIEAFDSPEAQAEKVSKLLLDVIKQSVKAEATETQDADGNSVKTEYGKLIDSISVLQKGFVAKAEIKIKEAERKMTEFTQEIFVGHHVTFDARADADPAACLQLFKSSAILRMGPVNGHMSTIDRQGSGARRTLMWSALKYAAESAAPPDSTQPFLLLLDEPELCLHPNAVREACRVLYDLPVSQRWQVMITTHSPVFIDLSRDNTTVVRVERVGVGATIKGTTVFRPSQVKLSNDDKELLKLLNMCDPYLCEFFFGGRTVLVEGDTEYTAFRYVQAAFPDDPQLRNIHVVRARGKSTLCLLARILNQFDSTYAVLNDADLPRVKRKSTGKFMKNPAWTNNQKIRDAVAPARDQGRCRHVSLIPNFERAFFNEEVSEDKPFNAYDRLKAEPAKLDQVKRLLHALVDFSKPVPEMACEWPDIASLEQKVGELGNWAGEDESPQV